MSAILDIERLEPKLGERFFAEPQDEVARTALCGAAGCAADEELDHATCEGKQIRVKEIAPEVMKALGRMPYPFRFFRRLSSDLPFEEITFGVPADRAREAAVDTMIAEIKEKVKRGASRRKRKKP